MSLRLLNTYLNYLCTLECASANEQSSTGNTHRFCTIFMFLEVGSVSTQNMSDFSRGKIHSFLYCYNVFRGWHNLQTADKWQTARWMRSMSQMASVQDGSESSCRTPLDSQSQRCRIARSLRGHRSQPYNTWH